MTENKRFRFGYVCGDFGLIDNDEWIDLYSMSENSEKNVQICINKMNELSEENEALKSRIEDYNTALKRLQDLADKKIKENEQLKSELKIYRKIANCSNCHYHNYDTLFGGDEDYEVCDKGNDVTDGICEDWREL